MKLRPHPSGCDEDEEDEDVGYTSSDAKQSFFDISGRLTSD